MGRPPAFANEEKMGFLPPNLYPHLVAPPLSLSPARQLSNPSKLLDYINVGRSLLPLLEHPRLSRLPLSLQCTDSLTD